MDSFSEMLFWGVDLPDGKMLPLRVMPRKVFCLAGHLISVGVSVRMDEAKDQAYQASRGQHQEQQCLGPMLRQERDDGGHEISGHC